MTKPAQHPQPLRQDDPGVPPEIAAELEYHPEEQRLVSKAEFDSVRIELANTLRRKRVCPTSQYDAQLDAKTKR